MNSRRNWLEQQVSDFFDYELGDEYGPVVNRCFKLQPALVELMEKLLDAPRAFERCSVCGSPEVWGNREQRQAGVGACEDCITDRWPEVSSNLGLWERTVATE